tara:strand:- start:1042 stop:1515 length:474 start_codon:yes stop_codon:yes gene_type:complete
MYKIGQGIDFHQLEDNLPLIIGSVKIPFYKGSKGHSDGDVLLHSITDAILGSIEEGDIGKHFPSSNKKWQGAESTIFLKFAVDLLLEKKYKIINIDSTVILQKPKISPFVSDIKKNISKIVHCNAISIKSTTTDFLGFIGKSKGVCAISTILISKES